MPLDAVSAITRDHRAMERLFEQCKKNTDQRSALVAEIKSRLTAHSKAEEERVYPEIVKAEPGEKQEVHHGVHEHREAEEKLAKVEAADPQSNEFDRALDEFVAAVQHHVQEEESEILPALAEAVARKRLEELGEAFEERRTQLLTAGGVEESAVNDDLTRDELYELAKQADIPGRSSMTKEELVRALRR
jgi:hemerythrin superfamily protein